MFRRLVRSAITFAAIFAAYKAYALLAVPWMEPPLTISAGRRPTQDDLKAAGDTVTKYQRLLSNYFPKDHWSQVRPPKVFGSSNEQALLVLDRFDRHDDGRVDIDRFALLVFPTPPRAGLTPPHDAIILEAPQGARLKFESFRPERGEIGRITRGQFPGRITIRSDMSEPGPQDDLLVETADLEMNTKLLYTTSPVRFRMGANVGAGRELEIRFLADEHVQPRDRGFKVAGLDSLEIRRDVRLRLQLETDSLLPGEEKPGRRAERANSEPSTSASQDARGVEERSPIARGIQTDKPPVEVSCSGPFHFDFVRYVASVDRDVELRQINPNGPSDQMTCNQLDIHFAPKSSAGAQPAPVSGDPSRRQQRDLGRLQPLAIVAQGHPVVVTSPSRSAEARGDRIQIGLRDRRVLIGGGQDVMLVYGPNVLRAPTIDYQHPAADDATGIGRFRASGPGSLHYMPDPAKPEQVLNATWQQLVELGRDNGQPALALAGRPQLAFGDMGSLAADQIKVHLRELQGTSAAEAGVRVSGAGKQGGAVQIVPDRLAATGSVEIHSAQLNGRTEELSAVFRLQPAANEPATAAGMAGRPTDAPNSNITSRLNLTGPDKPNQQSFLIDADRMRLDVKLRGKSAAPASVVCDGHVVFREMPVVRTAEQPLEIRGGQLIVDQLDTGTAHIILRGAAADSTESAGTAPQLAQLMGRGMTVRADVVELDQRDNRLWSHGPGKATLIVTRDLDGSESTTPIPLELSWQGGLQFDGRNIVFQKNVVVAGTDYSVSCDELAARLTRTVQFGQAVDQNAMDLEEIECRRQVVLDHRGRDAVGIVSYERMKLERLSINQKTGVISGDGPGEIRSTRFGQGLATLAGSPGGAPTAAAAAPTAGGGSKLHFLRVEFLRGLAGNLVTRELEFHERVRTVYGPVDSWEQELDLNRPESLPPEAVTLLCDHLRLNEDPIAARASANENPAEKKTIGPVQLQAQGNVWIEGAAPGQGVFGAQADRASYEQSKDVFMLEGNGREPAKLWQKRGAAENPAPASARKIRYTRATGAVKVEGIDYGEITPGDIEQARRSRSTRQ